MLITIKVNKAINIIVEPEKEDGPKSILNSLWSFFLIVLNKIEIFVWEIQKLGVINSKIKVALSQFNEKKLDDGSKAEKRLVIMFI